MSIGIMELIILLLIGGGLLLGLVIFGMLLAMLRGPRQGMSRQGLPLPAGPAASVRKLGPSDKPIAASAHWDGSELVVKSDEWATKALFDVPLDDVEQCLLTYRFRIQTNNLARSVYPELWCRIPERGQFFSRGLDRKVRGTNDWKEVEIPFYLQRGQRADLLHLNLVCEGPVEVRLKDIEVLSAPLKSA